MKTELRKVTDNELKKLIADHKKRLLFARQNAVGGIIKLEVCEDLSRVDLRGANLRGTDLSSATLNSSDLRGADLRNTMLANAHCIGINLKGAEVRKANFINTDFTKANLSGIKFNETIIGTPTLIESKLCGADFSGKDLRYTQLRNADLCGANFSVTDLRETDLCGAKFREADFSEANLSKADFRNADLNGVNFRGANLSEADFRNANLSGVNLSGANLILANLNNTNLSNADITGANLYGTIRDDWIINEIKCDYIFFDSEIENRKCFPKNREFEEGEFEELYTNLPTIEYYFQTGVTPFDMLIMDSVVREIQENHPQFGLKLDSFHSRGIPHAVFTVLLKEYGEKALKQIKNKYETKIKVLETERDTMKKTLDDTISKVIERQGSKISIGGNAENTNIINGNENNTKNKQLINEDAKENGLSKLMWGVFASILATLIVSVVLFFFNKKETISKIIQILKEAI